MLEAGNIRARYGAEWIVAGVSFSLSPGEILLVRGNNGSGKSTLLKGLSNSGGVVCDGEIRFNGEVVGARRFSRRFLYRNLYAVPQCGGVFDDLTGRENLVIASRGQKARLAEGIPASLAPFLETVKNIRAGLLSGGQQKALAVLMGLVSGAPLLFLDEPFAGLSEDGGLGDQVLKALLEAHADGKTMLIAEHRSVHLVRLLEETPAVRVLEMRDGKLAPKNGAKNGDSPTEAQER
jgi:ABC-type branched-subunit amino acid transport system ATPase component